MGVEAFATGASESTDGGDDRLSESLFDNCRIESLDPSSLSLPDFVEIWVSRDGLTAMMDVNPQYFREHVSTEVKDQAKEKGLIFLDSSGPAVVLTDDPESYGEMLALFGLEDYLVKRIGGAI